MSRYICRLIDMFNPRIYNFRRVEIRECPICCEEEKMWVFPSCKMHKFCKKCLTDWSKKCKEQFQLLVQRNQQNEGKPPVNCSYLSCPLCRL